MLILKINQLLQLQTMGRKDPTHKIHLKIMLEEEETTKTTKLRKSNLRLEIILMILLVQTQKNIKVYSTTQACTQDEK